MEEGLDAQHSPTQADYSRVGARVRARRKQLGLTQADVAERGGPSSATLRQIENGRGADYRRGTIGPLEQILGWTEGSIERDLYFGQSPIQVGGAALSGTGALTTGGTPLTRMVVGGWKVQNPPAETTLQDAITAVADHERDFTIAASNARHFSSALGLILQGDMPGDPQETLEDVFDYIEQMIAADGGRRYWQSLVDTLRAQEDALRAAARRAIDPTAAQRRAQADAVIEMDPP